MNYSNSTNICWFMKISTLPVGSPSNSKCIKIILFVFSLPFPSRRAPSNLNNKSYLDATFFYDFDRFSLGSGWFDSNWRGLIRKRLRNHKGKCWSLSRNFKGFVCFVEGFLSDESRWGCSSHSFNWFVIGKRIFLSNFSKIGRRLIRKETEKVMRG